MRARVFKLLYLIAIAVAMMGWLWLLIEAIAQQSINRRSDDAGPK